jgi:DnaK suppressor protein
MKKEIKEELKETLEKEREKIIKQLKKFAEKDKKIRGNWKSKFPTDKQSNDGTEEAAADRVEEYSNVLGIEHSLELKLRNINLALDKIEKGKYGICEKCGKEISEDRLKVCPEARYCLKCKKEE